MARKFLYIVAGLIVLVFATFVALRLFAQDLTEVAFVPSAKFTDQPPLEPSVYGDPKMWLAHPELGEENAARWLPQGFAAEGETVNAAVFFVHPTGLVSRDRWNASLNDADSRERSRLFVQGMASPFNRSADVWAPRYRQAAVGAFLTDAPEATQALDLAYEDVEQAFETFVASVDGSQPIVLAGHSQGAFHLLRLIRDHVADTPLAKRIAAAYVIGWPVSKERDLPKMGMSACAEPTSTGCVVSWISFADPPETQMLMKAYSRRPGLDGQPVGEAASFVCVNPITGNEGGSAEGRANLGTLLPDISKGTGTLVAGIVPARCGEDNLLHIGPAPDLEMGPYVLPGNNYHLYDVTLFWANLRADFARRVEAWKQQP
ncbi:DUF3089 domain-containing protein [Novosphingobium sp. M1R2S20]|uniref:DUF3089 domain-containing protein n=1 Tax=Novosphingobium rhizovicinum TaxID=3228928 RepID=A0ABV3RD92_9SPHN